MFNKRINDIDNNKLVKKAAVGVVDFQDAQYKQYLKNKEIRK
jgi:hypothetical protein